MFFAATAYPPSDDTAMENLARYIIRASFSQERMQYLDQEGQVVYTGKDRKTNKVFPVEMCAECASFRANKCFLKSCIIYKKLYDSMQLLLRKKKINIWPLRNQNYTAHFGQVVMN
jgi:hypothetical protein